MEQRLQYRGGSAVFVERTGVAGGAGDGCRAAHHESGGAAGSAARTFFTRQNQTRVRQPAADEPRRRIADDGGVGEGAGRAGERTVPRYRGEAQSAARVGERMNDAG